MATDIRLLSEGFQRLYCDRSVYDSFSAFHPISFARVLPFQSQDPVVDDELLIGAEEAHLADRNDMTRREVIEALTGSITTRLVPRHNRKVILSELNVTRAVCPDTK